MRIYLLAGILTLLGFSNAFLFDVRGNESFCFDQVNKDHEDPKFELKLDFSCRDSESGILVEVILMRFNSLAFRRVWGIQRG